MQGGERGAFLSIEGRQASIRRCGDKCDYYGCSGVNFPDFDLDLPHKV